MEYITIRRIMDRLLINPNFKKLEKTQVAGYVKDLCGIVEILPVLTTKWATLNIEDYKAEVPIDSLEVRKVYLCKDDATLHPAVHEDNALLAAKGANIQMEEYGDNIKSEYGEWTEENGVIFTDISSFTKVIIQYRAMKVDDIGFPMLPYDGSLMAAVLAWVKYHHYTILGETNALPEKWANKAEQQYDWYIAQYISKKEIPTEDEGISIANSWQRLVTTRNRNERGSSYPQFVMTAARRRYRNGYKY